MPASRGELGGRAHRVDSGSSAAGRRPLASGARSLPAVCAIPYSPDLCRGTARSKGGGVWVVPVSPGPRSLSPPEGVRLLLPRTRIGIRGFQREARRGYRHWWRVLPEDFELSTESMPKDVKTLMASNPDSLGFIDSYWYWRIRAESTIMDPENLPKKSYQQLCRDMGLTIVNEAAEHILGIIELYEYLKSSPFIGPFGTIENPVLVPAIHTERVVGCSGGTGDSEHVALWFRCREGFLYRCGECDQIFMLVRVMYEVPEGEELNPIDPDVKDVFDFALLEKGNEVWNSGGMIHWATGYDALHGTLYGGMHRDELNEQRAIGE